MPFNILGFELFTSHFQKNMFIIFSTHCLMAVSSSNTDYSLADNHSYRKSNLRIWLVQARSTSFLAIMPKISLRTYIERIESQE